MKQKTGPARETGGAPRGVPEILTNMEAILKAFPKPSYYPGQKEAIEQICAYYAAGYMDVILEGPTGTGKSAIAVTLARLLQAYMLTSQKLLQAQYEADFPELAVVRGRNAYSCDVIQGYADVAPCVEFKRRTESPCELDPKGAYTGNPKHTCPYAEALVAGEQAHTTLFNYHAFYAHKNDGAPDELRFPKRSLMIMDEAHGLEGVCMGMVQLVIDETHAQLQHTTMLDLVQNLHAEGPYVMAVIEASRTLTMEIKVLPSGKERTKLFRKKAALLALAQRMVEINWRYLKTLEEGYEGPSFESQWIMKTETLPGSDRPTKLTLKPVFAGPFVPKMFFNRGSRRLFMSATILDKKVFCESVGLKPETTAFVSIPCHFPVENRLVHVYPCGDLTYRTYPQGIKGVIQGIKRVLEHHKGQRGIIHTHSFKVLKDIQWAIKDRRLIFQDAKTRDRNEYVDMLKESKDGVLVAPAMHEGLDLKDDWSRFQIIVKIPWPDFSDPQIQARAKVDDRWYVWQTALKMVQQGGRSVRSATDYAATYILDAAFFSFYERSRVLEGPKGKKVSMLPPWFRDALRLYDEHETREFLAGRDVPAQV